MAGHLTDMFSFTSGALRRKDIGYLLITDDKMRKRKIPHFGLAQWKNGEWADGGRYKWNCTTMTVVRAPREQALAVGEFGNAVLAGSGDLHEEQIASKESIPEDRGPLRCVRYIGNHAYVVGMDRQVYRREDVNRWSAIDEGARPPADQEEVVGFEAIDGFSEKEIYAAGWEGEIWLYNGIRWKQLHSPTNLILTNLCCADEVVYASGRLGLLVEGRRDKWKIVDQDVIEDDIWGLAWYRDALYLSTMGAVYRMYKGKIEIVKMGKDEPDTCYHLSAADGVLWSIGAKDVMAFDGKTWTRID